MKSNHAASAALVGAAVILSACATTPPPPSSEMTRAKAAIEQAQRAGARELFALIKRKAIRVHIGQRYPLAAAAQAHIDLESRRTIGSTVLIP